MIVSDPLASVIAAQSSRSDMPRSRNRRGAPSETDAIGVLRPISSADQGCGMRMVIGTDICASD